MDHRKSSTGSNISALTTDTYNRARLDSQDSFGQNVGRTGNAAGRQRMDSQDSFRSASSREYWNHHSRDRSMGSTHRGNSSFGGGGGGGKGNSAVLASLSDQLKKDVAHFFRTSQK